MQEKLLQEMIKAGERAANIQPTVSNIPEATMVRTLPVFDNHSYQNHSTNSLRTAEESYPNVMTSQIFSQNSNVTDTTKESISKSTGQIQSTKMDNGIQDTQDTHVNASSNVTNDQNNIPVLNRNDASTLLPNEHNPHNQHQQYWTANQMFLNPAHFHAPDLSRGPSPINMTYLTPSRGSPVVTAFQTPPMHRLRPIHAKQLTPPSDGETDKSCDDEEIDVVSESRSRTESGKDSDVSMLSIQSGKSTSPSGSSTKSTSPTGSTKSASPTGSSNDGSPGSRAVSPCEGPVRKKSRTNYTPSQVQALEKVFHENPYPDSEKMESLSKELDIPEGKIKVWFQNKRARWRRRVQDNAAHMAPFYAHMSPVMSPIPPYGLMNGMFCAPPSPAQVVPNALMYPNTPNSAPSTSHTSNSPQQSPTMTSPYQSRGQMAPPYFPMYPYGMFPPYYCS